MESMSDASNDLNVQESDSGLPYDMVTVPEGVGGASQSVAASEQCDDNERSYDLRRMDDIKELISTNDDYFIKNNFNEHIRTMIESHDFHDKYNFIFLIDVANSIERAHVERIYSAIQKFQDKNKDIVLFLRSLGGGPEPAYLISQLCNKFKKNKFIVVIPAEAKSAATLLSFGADEIHMGPMSELGPIDVQVDGVPLLSVSSALSKIASIVQEYPKSSSMFAEYLTRNLNIRLIGYYDRVTESATQYAQILLRDKHDDKTNKKAEQIANHFTNHYKDHGFVIDVEESKKILGPRMVKDSSDFYHLGAKILEFINTVEFIYLLSGERKRVVFVGSGCEMMLENANKDEVLLRDVRGLC
jgi:ATP-dependent protease ClpP protease subunit